MAYSQAGHRAQADMPLLRSSATGRRPRAGTNGGARGLAAAWEFLKHTGLEQVDAVGGSETLRMM